VLNINFIDFEKVFGSTQRESQWHIMELYSKPSKIITTIQLVHQNNEVFVMNNGLQSDWMMTENGEKMFQNVRIPVLLGAGLDNEEHCTGEEHMN
jgi:hypothetical protein